MLRHSTTLAAAAAQPFTEIHKETHLRFLVNLCMPQFDIPYVSSLYTILTVSQSVASHPSAAAAAAAAAAAVAAAGATSASRPVQEGRETRYLSVPKQLQGIRSA